ncbi:hypothetical protein TCAL_12727 [Tigriopus californicus]|uniref:Beta-1,4-glucuronyltransferase 1 n=1 Tax=Tigriopus californicus TaxID=6832 RepID=A0A553P2D9_TIGCA|nr:hypothetical protein TCAL_12727 [Tigriopus californicus]
MYGVHSSDGGSGERNPIGTTMFGPVETGISRDRSSRSNSAGQVRVPLRGVNTIVCHAATIWNQCPELRAATTQSDYDKFEDDENAIASRKPLKDLNQIGYIKYLQNLVVGSEWLELSSQSKVTLFSQSSLDHLSSLVKVGEQWKGPISVAIYVPGVDFHLTKLYINYLQNCHPQLMSRMTVHFGVPLDCTPDIEAPNIPISLGDCPSNEIVVDTLVSWRAEKVIRFLNNTPYPYNTLRNLARNAVQTEYLMMIDMELIPSQNMFQGLEEFLRQNKTKDCFTCAYVIPQFEIEPSAYWELPKAKKQLITMVKSKLAEPFYGSKYKPLSHCVEGYKWLDVPDSSKVEIAFRMNYTSLCEPIVVLRSTAPGYQNEFRGFGFDRVSQRLPSTSTDAVWAALSRWFSLFGLPTTIKSDTAPSFARPSPPSA